jgi:hypothetical protein
MRECVQPPDFREVEAFAGGPDGPRDDLFLEDAGRPLSTATRKRSHGSTSGGAAADEEQHHPRDREEEEHPLHVPAS